MFSEFELIRYAMGCRKGVFFIDCFFLCSLVLLFVLQTPGTLIFATLLCIFYALLRHKSVIFQFHKSKVVFFISLFLVINHFLGGAQGVTSIFYLFSTIACFYAAVGFGSSSLRHVGGCLFFVYWIYVFFVISGFLSNCDDVEPLGAVIPGASTNGLPSYLIVLQIALSLLVLLDKFVLPVISATVTFFIAILGFGRGSVIVSFSVLVFSIFFNLMIVQSKNGYRQVYLLVFFSGFVFLAVIGYVFAVGWNQASLLFPGSGVARWICNSVWFPLIASGDAVNDVAGTKWIWGIADPARARMLYDYIGKLDFSGIWFGVNYEGTSIVSDFKGNPHNSYIRLHSHYGLPGLFLVFYSILLLIISNKDSYFKFATFFLVFFVLLRAVTEPIIFPTVLDFFYFLYFVVYFNYAAIGREWRTHAK